MRYGGRVPGALQVDIGAVAAGHLLDLGDRILLGDVDGHRRSGLAGQLELARVHVQGDDLCRELGGGSGDHAQADGAAARNDDDVGEGDLGPLHGVQRTRERLGERGVRRRDVLADLVDE